MVFDRDEERREMPPITVISTISLEVITGHTVEPTYHHHFGIHKFIFVFPNKDDNRRDSTGRKVIEVTKEFHEISISDTETESELNTTNEEAGGEAVRRGEKEKVKEEEDGEETDAAPTRQMVMPKVAMPSGCCFCCCCFCCCCRCCCCCCCCCCWHCGCCCCCCCWWWWCCCNCC